MSSPFVAQIKIFAFNFPPTGWAYCDGQQLSISQNTALFSLLGTMYGGNGETTFALPDFQGYSPMHWGQGQGLSQRFIGEQGGEDYVTLLQTEMPVHNHNLMAKTSGGQADPASNMFGVAGTVLPPPNFYESGLGSPQTMSPFALSIAGGSQPHNNLMPYLVLNFCIALQGVYPARN